MRRTQIPAPIPAFAPVERSGLWVEVVREERVDDDESASVGMLEEVDWGMLVVDERINVPSDVDDADVVTGLGDVEVVNVLSVVATLSTAALVVVCCPELSSVVAGVGYVSE